MRSKDFESSHDASLVPNASTSATSKLSQHEFAERCGDPARLIYKGQAGKPTR